MTAASDIAYGRQGGRWIAHHPGRLLAEIRALIAQARAEGWAPVDLSRLFHPHTIAATLAHQHHCGARPDPADIAAVWTGWARMAAARRAAGQPLDDLDRQALARLDDPGADPR